MWYGMVCMAVKFNELRCIKNKLTKYDGDRSLQVSNSQGSLASYKIWKKCFYFQTLESVNPQDMLQAKTSRHITLLGP